MKKIKSTNGIHFFIDDKDFDLVNTYSWRAEIHGRGYRISRNNCHTYNGEWHSKTAFLHRFLLKAKKGQIVDHIDGNPLNNCRSNLRFCTHQENLWNKPLRKDSTTGLIGVRHNKKWNTWTVRFALNGKRLCLGTFKSSNEAVLVYNQNAILHRGKFAKLNIL